MAKGKSKSEKGKEKEKDKKVNKGSNKGPNKTNKGNSKAKRKKPLKSPKKAVARKKTTKTKAKQILSKETWKKTRDSKGKLQKGRRKTLKLKTQGDKNRYQSIVKAISDYYKKAGFDEVWIILIIYILFLLLWAYTNNLLK